MASICTYNTSGHYLSLSHYLEKMADYQHLPYSSICCTDSSIASDLAILMKDITTSTLQLLGNGVEQYLSPHRYGESLLSPHRYGETLSSNFIFLYI